jgi:hypothetical protein
MAVPFAYVALSNRLLHQKTLPGLPANSRGLVSCRDMNAWTSQEVFAGPYLQDPVERKKFSSAFIDMTVVRDIQP